MIESRNIVKRFGKAVVLDDISFRAEAGEIYGLIGYNGVGKTTLMKIMGGIYRPDSGTVLFDGEPIYENAEKKKLCFFMTEEATCFSKESLEQMRKFYRGYYDNWNDKTFYGLVEMFGVDPKTEIGRFSKGMQRQASLALAFATRSKCYFLDEAFDGLDFTKRRQMKEMLVYYARTQDAAIIVSSHNLRELEDLSDRIGMLSDGKLIFDDGTKRMRETFSTCQFRTEAGAAVPENLGAELLERDGNECLCILKTSCEEAEKLLEEAGMRNIRVRPIGLEEFFQMERKEKSVDWEEIFG